MVGWPGTDMEDKLGKHVLLKVNSRPGCNWLDLLCKAHFCVLYIFPSLPNTTSEQQEMDHNYRQFKSTMRLNHDAIATCCFVRKEPIQLTISIIGLIMYGRVCLQTGVVCKGTVANAFSTKRNLGSWAVIGAVLFTMQCWSNPKLRHNSTNMM
jgi:hypothetical protein